MLLGGKAIDGDEPGAHYFWAHPHSQHGAPPEGPVVKGGDRLALIRCQQTSPAMTRHNPKSTMLIRRVIISLTLRIFEGALVIEI